MPELDHDTATLLVYGLSDVTPLRQSRFTVEGGNALLYEAGAGADRRSLGYDQADAPAGAASIVLHGASRRHAGLGKPSSHRRHYESILEEDLIHRHRRE
jgi:hypothetical protein